MKKFLLILLGIVIAVGAIVGAGMIIHSCNVQKATKEGITTEVSLIEDEYAKGDLIMFRVRATSDKELTRMTYKINNGTEVEITCKTGKSADMEGAFGSGANYIDTGVEMIESEDMEAGNYVIQFFFYDVEDSRYSPIEKIVIEIEAVQTAS